jgi:tetratricopeptide (TPR) repeat protein
VGEHARGNIFSIREAMSGRVDDSINWARQRLERDPLDTSNLMTFATIEQFAGHLDESAAIYRRVLEMNSDYGTAHAQYAVTLLLMRKNAEALETAKKESDEASKFLVLGCVYWTMGRQAEADSALSALERGFADRKAYEIAAAHACRGEADAAFAWLERAYQQRRGSLQFLKIYPLFQKLHDDPRFDALLHKAKLVG